MTKILVMTDPHLTANGATIIGLSPVARFAEGLAHAARVHPDAARLVVMGDLTQDGKPEEYAQLSMMLQGLPWPVSLMMGNHDLRRPFRAAFPDAPVDQAGFVQAVVELDAARLVLLDTLEEAAEPEHSGRLCPTRMAWLRAVLSDSDDRPTLVFLHHPPFDTGFAGIDGINLTNAAELRADLRGAGVAHVFAGHVHRTITATIDGLSMTIFKSPCHQMPMLLGKPGFGHSIDEPGAYGIVLVRGHDVVVHFEDFSLPAQVPADGLTGS